MPLAAFLRKALDFIRHPIKGHELRRLLAIRESSDRQAEHWVAVFRLQPLFLPSDPSLGRRLEPLLALARQGLVNPDFPSASILEAAFPNGHLGPSDLSFFLSAEEPLLLSGHIPDFRSYAIGRLPLAYADLLLHACDEGSARIESLRLSLSLPGAEAPSRSSRRKPL